jgi:hypothetical protein
MSWPLIAACGFAYLWVCIEQAMKGHWPMAVVYGGYALANVGLVILARNS